MAISEGEIGGLLKNFILALITVCVFTSVGWTASKSEDYDLHEKCMRRAKDFFAENDWTEYSKDENDKVNDSVSTTSFYSNHYNKKLNKCFVLITTSTMYFRKEGAVDDILTQKVLWDANEYKDFADISIYKRSGKDQVEQCDILDKTCHTEEEWNFFIKPYMEE